MSASSVIGDVTSTMEELLKDEQLPKDTFSVSLKSPAEETVDPSMKPKVNLFLFRVAENPFAKNQLWEPLGVDARRYPQLALNLLYVLTPYANDKLSEHRILGEAMRIFHDHAIIEATKLQGVLEHSREELKIVLCPLSFEELTRIWNALNKPYRLSVCYEVRIVLIDSRVKLPVKRVIDQEFAFSHRPEGTS